MEPFETFILRRIFTIGLITLKKKSFTSRTFVFFAANISCAAINFFTLIILSRFLTPKEYGELALFISYTGISTALISLSLEGSVSVTYFREKTQEFRDHVISVMAITCILVFVTLIIVALFSEYLKSLTGLPIKWLTFGVLYAGMQAVINIKLNLWIINGDALVYAFFQIGQALVSTALTFIFAVSGNSGWHSRGWSILTTSLLFLLVCLYSLIKTKQCAGKIKLIEIKKALSFGVPLIPHVSGLILFSSADRILVNSILGPSSTGLYQLASQIGSVVNLAADAINKTFSPWIYKNLSNASAEFKRNLVLITYIYFFVAISIGLGSYFIPFNIARLVGGDRYSKANDLIPYFVLAQCIGAMYFMIVNYVFYTGKTTYLSVSTLVSGGIGLFSGYFLINKFGILGGGVALIISKTVHFLLSWLISSRVYPMPWNLFKSQCVLASR
jgi:O-antigen/teichoic acid export membrane protein